MYLSNRDLQWAIECGRLIVDPPPRKIDPTSIDLHLDRVEEARVWDVMKYQEERGISGDKGAELRIGKFRYGDFSRKYLTAVPGEADSLVFRRDREVIIKPTGFLLWQTKERVGTPEAGANLICFIDGKSTRSRTGLLVHLTAPTIHASWSGKVTLEIANVGPFDLVLEEDDVVAQITVAAITSIPNESMKESGSVTFGQADVTGRL
jgi:dCTP deaminase